jgi:hypothetical protein
LAYYSSGAASITEAYQLPVYLRHFYLKCLINAKKQEQEQTEKTEKFDNRPFKKG